MALEQKRIQGHLNSDDVPPVVVRERVVVVVEPLAGGQHGHQPVLGGVDADVIGPVAPQVGGRVDQPRRVEDDGVPGGE